MKKIVVFLFLSCSLSLNGQNIQFITNGKLNFATFEIYKPLDHGTLYYFTDFKMSKNGIDEAYSEISGYLNISKTISVTAQYNAGLNKDFTIFPVYLFGISKSFSVKEHLSLSMDILYRHQNFLYIEKEKLNGYQVTVSFTEDLRKFQISGYCDFWNAKYIIFEPQGWYKIFNNTWIGLEVRLSNYIDILNYDDEGNFIGNYSNYIMAGLKWNISY
jgi:hypothetical protein